MAVKPHELNPAGTILSPHEWLAALQLQSDAGHGECESGDDEESQEFDADVRRLNPNWTPGTIPKVPAGLDGRGLRERARFVVKPAATTSTVSPRPQPTARAPRGRRVRIRVKARGPDDPPDPPARPVAIPLAAFRRDVARWLEAVKP